MFVGVDERAAAANIARGGWRACAESWGGVGRLGRRSREKREERAGERKDVG